jgi:hypothetical protein
LPLAVASPVQTQASPSDSTDSSPVLPTVTGPMTVTGPAVSKVARWTVVLSLDERLPAAAFTPLLATPAPMFTTAAVWGATTTPMPSTSASRSWLSSV